MTRKIRFIDEDTSNYLNNIVDIIPNNLALKILKNIFPKTLTKITHKRRWVIQQDIHIIRLAIIHHRKKLSPQTLSLTITKYLHGSSYNMFNVSTCMGLY